MGMFDYISCEMPLPRGGANTIPTFRYDHQFQTKDLVNCLIEYKIGNAIFISLKFELVKERLSPLTSI